MALGSTEVSPRADTTQILSTSLPPCATALDRAGTSKSFNLRLSGWQQVMELDKTGELLGRFNSF